MMRLRVRKVVVANAGTPVPGPAVLTKKFILAALENNGLIFYGGPDIDATHRGELLGKESREFTAPVGQDLDLSQLRIDASVNGEGVEVIYYEHF